MSAYKKKERKKFKWSSEKAKQCFERKKLGIFCFTKHNKQFQTLSYIFIPHTRTETRALRRVHSHKYNRAIRTYFTHTDSSALCAEQLVSRLLLYKSSRTLHLLEEICAQLHTYLLSSLPCLSLPALYYINCLYFNRDIWLGKAVSSYLDSSLNFHLETNKNQNRHFLRKFISYILTENNYSLYISWRIKLISFTKHIK